MQISLLVSQYFEFADLGAGKTTLARGFVQCKLGAQSYGLRVTSPTYLLSHTYSYQDEESTDDTQQQ